MSSRTIESNKAITAAWVIEKQLVSEGKGTRDWTPEQQQDILVRGKAYDENGKAFRGHHMRSVSICPEEQGNPDNIQFLSHEEHIEAHVVCWQPTNWYYDPVTKERVDFGDGPIVPCKVIELSEPVVTIETVNKPQPDAEVKPVQPEENRSTGTDPPKANSTPKPRSVNRPAIPVHTPEKTRGIGAFIKKAGYGIVKAAKATGTFIYEHKEEISALAIIADSIFKAVVGSSNNSSSKNNSSHGYPPFSDSSDYDSNYDSSEGYESNHSEADDKDYPGTHASPKEHIVPGHGQHYHTKGGKIWKEKAPFKRGGKQSDD